MIDPSPVSDHRNFRIMGIVMTVVVVVVATGAVALLVVRQSGISIAPGALTASATPLALTLRRAIEVRTGPAPDQPIVTRLAAGLGVHVLGRSIDGTWVVVGLNGAPDIVGWVPADAVEGIRDVSRLAVIAGNNSVPTAGSGAPGPRDLPDLRIESAASRNNRLVAVIVNDGPGDLPTPLLVALNGGTPVRVDTKAGEPLRAGARLEAVLPNEYVQLRARIALQVQTEPANRETNVENNGWSGIVEPDQPNNLGIGRAVANGPDRHLLVTVQNDSPIPVRGMITITVREAPPSTTLLGRDAREVVLETGKSLDIPFSDIRNVDLTRIAVKLSTDAIHDAVLADDSYPR